MLVFIVANLLDEFDVTNTISQIGSIADDFASQHESTVPAVVGAHTADGATNVMTGAALREFAAFLQQLDAAQHFAGLQKIMLEADEQVNITGAVDTAGGAGASKVHRRAGEVCWMCAEHAAAYRAAHSTASGTAINAAPAAAPHDTQQHGIAQKHQQQQQQQQEQLRQQQQAELNATFHSNQLNSNTTAAVASPTKVTLQVQSTEAAPASSSESAPIATVPLVDSKQGSACCIIA